MEAMNFEAKYLRSVFGFLGITDVTVIEGENANAGDELMATSFEAARGEIRRFVGQA